MRNLLRSSCMRYLKSPLTWGIAAFILLAEILLARQTVYTEYDGTLILSLNVLSFLLPLALGAMVVVLTVGREFSDHTVRNKIITGSSKPQIFLSESVTAAAFMSFCYLLTTVPLLCFAQKGFAQLPEGTEPKLFVMFYLLYPAVGILTVLITCLAAQRTAAVIITGGVLFGLYFGGITQHGLLSVSFAKTNTAYVDENVYDEEGNCTLVTKEYEEPNPFYLPDGRRHFYRTLGALNPGYTLMEAVMYTEYQGRELMRRLTAEDMEEASWQRYWAEIDRRQKEDTDFLMIEILMQCGLIVLLLGAGAFSFRLRDLK